MKEPKKYSFYRKICLLTSLIMVVEACVPTISFALTGGPSQPEFSSFEPVATTNMVSDFSGDFTYNLPVVNIPGANGGGYALSLSYHAGTTNEEEASWVGHGWTLNPGSISRNKRGFPDDYNATTVKYWNITPANKTASVGVSANVEAFSLPIPLSLNASLRYNNYKGFGYTAGAGVSFDGGLVSLGYSVSDGNGSFSVRVNPAAALSKGNKDASEPKYDNARKKKVDPAEEKIAHQADIDARHAATKEARNKSGFNSGPLTLVGSGYSAFSFGAGSRNMNLTGYHGGSFNVTANVCATLTPFQVGPTFDLNGSYNWQENVNSSGVPNASDPLPVYGYMYSSKAPSTGASMMDYYMEKLSPYDRQDKYLGMPFSNADNYGVSGEGLGGGFRLYNKKAGTFRPNSVKSRVVSVNVGAEVEAGLNIGGGGNLGVGFQQLTSNNWNDALVSSVNFADSATADEPYFFRYNNDPGGSQELGTNESAQKAKLAGGGIPGFKSYNPVLTSDIITTANGGSRSGRSSYVSYHTNKEMLYAANGKNYKRYQFGDTANAVYRKNLPDQIGELTTFNEDGLRYVYGQPVYSRKEGNMKYDLQNLGAGSIDHNYIAYKNITSNLKTKIGEERDVPYATTYLLTDITTPDYVDRTMDGPTDDDFGGYTRFSYARLHGSYDKMDYSNNSWYKWRMPYRGLQYERGELSTQLDDMGTVAYGEKEIYYLDTIITKTHFAVFRTSVRLDGLGAKDNNTAAASRSASDTTSLRKLDRIDIYAKNSGGSPLLIKSVRFSYDYTTSTGLPNTSGGTGGRLTLKKVWFEYNGIYNARINPYVFTYAYPTSTQEANYPAKYRALKDTVFSSGDQNPSYSPFDIDAWGNYQKNGNNRYDSMRTWVNQNPSPTFDPAAWQLKDIKLPTGGEIRIQYEQDDYAYVQDQPVHAMMSLKSTSNDAQSGSNQYYLNMKDIGMTETTPDYKALRQKIQDLYVTPQKKMYFKFLYHLDDPIGSTSVTPSINSCNAEYIKGYCSVLQTGIDAGGLYVRLGSSTIGSYDLPKKVCRNYVKTQRLGTLDLSGNCNPSVDGIGSNTDPLKIAENLVGFLSTIITPGDLQLCKTVNFPLSYLKVPIPKAKKGGGLRVKRILMYDNGIESGDVSIFGSQYSYTMPDGSSSGVATNEPGTMREENALVQFDAKFKQSFLSKIVAGRDKEQVELPLGEGIYPSPSVGYSRIVIQNIHSGVTNTGFIVKEFYTAKDYPVKVDYTSIDTQRDFLPVPGGTINVFINNIWMSQGFVFKLNNMHGQPKSETTYRGSPTDVAATIGSQQVFSYFQPGEQVPMMGAVNSIIWANPGKEMETVFDSRGMEDISHNLEIAFDVDLGLFGLFPVPFASIAPSYTYTEGKMYSHTTTKVINYPAIKKSTVSYADGIYHTTDNVAFNPNTGKPVLTRTTDGYHQLALQQDANHSGRYYHYDLPATGSYPLMGQKAKNERFALLSTANVSIQKKTVSGKYYLEFTPASGQSVCTAMNSLNAGDLIKITDPTASPKDLGLYHVSDSISGNNLFILQTAAYGPNTYYSNTATHGVIIEVIKSGFRNQLNTSIGSFTTYGDTARVINPHPGQISARQTFVDTLNAGLKRAIVCGCTVILPGTSFPSSVGITSRHFPNCAPFLTSGNQQISISGGRVGFVGTYCDESYPAGGSFGLDPITQQLIYLSPGNQCHGINVTCYSFCESIVNSTQVVQAEAKTMKDKWPYDNAVYAQVTGSDPYENGTRGKWRQRSSYVYNDTIIGANAAGQRNYKNAGVFTLKLFNWLDSTQIPAQWLKLNTVNSYSPDGNAMEEQDILGVKSAAKFGYKATQPYLVAKNADYQGVQFESFENQYAGNKFEDGWAPVSSFTRDQTIAHSGLSSLKLVATALIDLKPLKITQQMLNSGLDMKVWVRDTAKTPATALTGSIAGTPNVTVNFSQIARTGEWSLYEGKASSTSLAVYSIGALVTPKIQNNYSSLKTIWIDDLRVQPLDAQVMAYVYDIASLRLIASFDDQNFGLFYQYNAEGKLVRKMVETQNGLKTVTETQYHTPGTARNH